jgi:hypothetical protein
VEIVKALRYEYDVVNYVDSKNSKLALQESVGISNFLSG